MHSYTTFLERLKNNTTTCVEETTRFLDTIDARPSLNAFLNVQREAALKQAAESDSRYAHNTARPLEGMVVALKDNISTKGIQTTCGSKILQGFSPVYDATTVQRLRENGAIIIGKTNMDEFAMGSSNENSAFGYVEHPLQPDYVPGGSSGGSAVAVAAGLSHVSLGSDTGGSIRQPAAFCGVIGYKPTYGRVSRYGLVAFASSLDQIGPFTHTVEDTARLLDALSGFDTHDSTTAALPPTKALEALDSDFTKPVIGVLPDELLEGCSEDVFGVYQSTLELMKNAGWSIKQVELQGKDAWIPTYYILATAEASSNLARFDGVRFGLRVESESADMYSSTRSVGFGDEVKRRIMLGTYVLSSGYYDAYYKKGQQARRLVYDGYTTLFSHCDALFLPTTPTTAFKRGEKTGDPIAMYLSDLFTVSANLAGIPAISFPAGHGSNGMPIGMQLQTASMRDEYLLQLTQHVMSLRSH